MIPISLSLRWLTQCILRHCQSLVLYFYSFFGTMKDSAFLNGLVFNNNNNTYFSCGDE
jgi:hypothetical protein